MNVMQKIRIEKLTLNIGCGKDQAKLEKGVKLLKNITVSGLGLRVRISMPNLWQLRWSRKTHPSILVRSNLMNPWR